MKKNMALIKIPVSELIPYARNARTHTDEQVAQIAASIREFGWTNPVLIDGEKGIIAGHGRVLAARKLGIEEVPCIELSHLTDGQKRAYVIADNKLTLNGEWDMKRLSSELLDLNSLSFDLDLTGFSVEEVENILDLPTLLKEKKEELVPIRWTRILISLPTSIRFAELDIFLKDLASRGAEVDFGGN